MGADEQRENFYTIAVGAPPPTAPTDASQPRVKTFRPCIHNLRIRINSVDQHVATMIFSVLRWELDPQQINHYRLIQLFVWEHVATIFKYKKAQNSVTKPSLSLCNISLYHRTQKYKKTGIMSVTKPTLSSYNTALHQVTATPAEWNNQHAEEVNM